MIYGYGILLTSIPLTTKRKSTTNAYMALRKYLIDDIIIEAIPNLNSERIELEFLTNSLSPGDVIVFATLEALGSNADEAYEVLYKIGCFGADWAILNEPQLSTYNIESYESFNFSFSEIEYILKDLRLANFGRTTGRKAIQLSEKFIDVFFDWQNYFISTDDACRILNMTTATFYNKASGFIKEPRHRQKYLSLYDSKMKEWKKKPMRGAKFKEPTYLEILRDIQREYGAFEKWKLSDIETFILFKYPSVDLIPQDVMRLYLNFSQPGATTRAAKQFYNPEVLKKYE